MAVAMKNAVYWDVGPCSSCVNQRFGGMSIHTRTTLRHIQENGILIFSSLTRNKILLRTFKAAPLQTWHRRDS
jgi:hypothetical protein